MTLTVLISEPRTKGYSISWGGVGLGVSRIDAPSTITQFAKVKICNNLASCQ